MHGIVATQIKDGVQARGGAPELKRLVGTTS